MKSPIKINDQSIDIPTSWEEITFGQYLRIKEAKTDAEILAGITGIELQVCEQVSPEVIAIILHPFLELTSEPLPEVVTEYCCGIKIPADIGKMQFARKINSDAAIKKFKDEIMIGRIVSIYLAPTTDDLDIENFYNNVLNEKLLFVFSCGQNLIEQLKKLNESEAKIPAPQYRNEEIRAGITEFKKFGIFGLVRGIALRYGCTIEDIYQWSYNKVLLELKVSAEENNYQRKLNEILNPKK